MQKKGSRWAAPNTGRQCRYVLSAVAASMLMIGGAESAPSDSAVRTALEEHYVAGCSSFTVENFERLNGVPQRDGSYLVEVKFRIQYVPSDEVRRIIIDYYTKSSALDAQIRALEAKQPKDEERIRQGNIQYDQNREAHKNLLWPHLGRDRGTCRGAYPKSIIAHLNFSKDDYGKSGILIGMRGAYYEEYSADTLFVSSEKGWVLTKEPKLNLLSSKSLPEHHITREQINEAIARAQSRPSEPPFAQGKKAEGEAPRTLNRLAGLPSAQTAKAEVEPPKPSFDCAQASSKIERIICRVPEIAAADRDLAGLYNRALSTSDATRVKEEQRAWVRERNQCADDACVLGAYRDRIRILSVHQ